MDWYIVKFLYPHAFNKFLETSFPNTGIVSLSTLLLYDNKKLYSFFDKEGIFLIVERYHTSLWNYNISLKNGVCFGFGGGSKKSREEVEDEGFSECFAVLDKLLMIKKQSIY